MALAEEKGVVRLGGTSDNEGDLRLARTSGDKGDLRHDGISRAWLLCKQIYSKS